MRSLVVLLLFFLSFLGLCSAGQNESIPEIDWVPSLEKDLFLDQFPASKQEGLFFEKLILPRHQSMIKSALETGKNALFQGVYGDFHVQSNEGTIKSALHAVDKKSNPDSGWEKRSRCLIVGKDFAWMKLPGLLPRREPRPVTAEDLGATWIAALSGNEPPPLGGRDVRDTKPWPVLVTHAGQWIPNGEEERMRHRGMFVLSPLGVLENGLLWNGEPLDKQSAPILKEAAVLSRISALWWTQATERLKHPMPLLVLADKSVLSLTPNQWCRSFIEPGLPYMPENGGQWTQESLSSAITNLPNSGLGGRWCLKIPQEGNYEIIFSLNAPSSSGKNKLFFKKGEALIKVNDTSARMAILNGAEEVRIALDLFSGEQSLEINVTGQGKGNASLSVPYARISYKGERVTPLIDFQGKAK